MENLPLGLRFVPGDDELIYHLITKIKNPQYSSIFINDRNVYEYDPETLTNLYQSNGKNEWHFFSVREASKNRKGAKRTAGNGYWRATVPNKAVSYDGGIVGYRKGLEYMRGNPSKGEKTPWLMHEYTVDASEASLNGINNIANNVETWSVCKIYKSNKKRKSQVYDIDTHGELEAGNGCRPRDVEQEARKRISSTHVDDPMNYPADRFGVGEYICSESITNPTNQENESFSRLESWDMLELEKLLNEEKEAVSSSESWDMVELEKLLNQEDEVVSRSKSDEVVSRSESWDMVELEKLLNEV